MDAELQASYDHARSVARRCARNFFYGMRLTPEPKRAALYAVYAWMHAADELADGPEPRETTADCPTVGTSDRDHWDSFRRDTAQTLDPQAPLPEGPIWPALRDAALRFDLPAQPLWDMLDGQRDDLEQQTYDTFDDLYAYCVRVASTVGRVCVHLWGHDGHPDVPALTETRGVALQLTNILRDLAEDARRGRCYLPRADLDRFGVSPDALTDPSAQPDAFDALMRFEIDQAQDMFSRSASLESHLSADCRASSAVIAGVYRALLERIAADPSAVRRGRVRVPTWRKLALAGTAVLRPARARVRL